MQKRHRNVAYKNYEVNVKCHALTGFGDVFKVYLTPERNYTEPNIKNYTHAHIPTQTHLAIHVCTYICMYLCACIENVKATKPNVNLRDLNKI